MYTIASAIKNHRLYAEFVKVKQRLADHQFVCWLAGGAVRDFCLKRDVGEFDLVTDASTENLKILFPDAVLVGESFGVLKIRAGGSDFFDLATFREEADYQDGRRPSQIKASTPVKDSWRRDFTINSLFWDDVREIVVDYQSGMADLEQKRLACVGESETRFTEDYLRILRLARFSVQLGFTIEDKTMQAAIKNLSKVNSASGERIWAEFNKIDKSQVWGAAFGSELLRLILNEIFKVEIKFQNIKVGDGLELKLAVVLYLMNPDFDCVDVLKNKLHISNIELTQYKNTRYVMHKLRATPIENIVYEFEKNKDVFEAAQQLAKVSLFDKKLYREACELQAEHPEKLITPQELLGLIPQTKIGDELKHIRINQLQKHYQTKADVVDYLKKKYA